MVMMGMKFPSFPAKDQPVLPPFLGSINQVPETFGLTDHTILVVSKGSVNEDFSAGPIWTLDILSPVKQLGWFNPIEITRFVF